MHTIECDERALNAGIAGCDELANIIVSSTKEGYRGQKMQAAAEFDMRMRQATGIAKVPYVAEFVRMLVESGEKVALFGWHRAVYSIWLQRLKDFNPVLYTGTETPSHKRANKERFVSGDARVIMISLRAGAGLDGLQHVCSTVVIGELDWSPGVHQQNIGRVDRDGQENPVMAYFLICEYGSDPIVADVLGVKRQQAEGIRNPDAEFVEELQVDPQHVKKLAEAYLRRRRA